MTMTKKTKSDPRSPDQICSACNGTLSQQRHCYNGRCKYFDKRHPMPKDREPFPHCMRILALLNAAFNAANIPEQKLLTEEDDDNTIRICDCILISFDCPHSRPTYTVCQEVIIPGVHTLRNGDPGWPDDVDVQELKTFQANQLSGLAKFVAMHIAERNIDQALDNFLEDEMVAQMTRESIAAENATLKHSKEVGVRRAS
jgi:hypothetical protein